MRTKESTCYECKANLEDAVKAKKAKGSELVGKAEQVELDVILQTLFAKLKLLLEVGHTTQLHK